MNNIKLALVNIKKNFSNAKELKSAFIISIIGMFINNFSFTFLWLYFGKSVGTLNGWEPTDIFGLYAISGISYGFVCAFLYGIYNIPSYISSGNFDKYLTTPKNTLIKVATSSISTSAIGDLLFGIMCYIIFILNTNLSTIQIITTLYSIILSIIVFFSFSLICMSISFYLMDGENVSNGIYGMFVSASLYHGGAFTGILRILFIFVVPSLLLGTLPVEIIKNNSIIGLIFITIMTILWFIFSVYFFYKSLKKYESNNFFGFGG